MIPEQSRDTYFTVSAPSKGLYKDRGSRFISLLYPVESEAEIKVLIASAKKEYFDARHHCFAYRLGPGGEPWRMSDDGEPSSTAGRPIFGQLLSKGLSDVLIIVVRYFGGVKLGVPGLIEAYRSAAADSIAKASIVEKTACETVSVRFGYEIMNSVMKKVKETGAAVIGQSSGAECTLTARVRLGEIAGFRAGMAKIGAEILHGNQEHIISDSSFNYA